MYYPEFKTSNTEKYDPKVIFDQLVRCGGNLKSVVGKDGCPPSYEQVRRYSAQFDLMKHYRLHMASVRSKMGDKDGAHNSKQLLKKLSAIESSLTDMLIPDLVVDPDSGDVIKKWKLQPTKYEAALSSLTSLIKLMRDIKGESKNIAEIRQLIDLNINTYFQATVMVLNNLVTKGLLNKGAMGLIINELMGTLNNMEVIISLDGTKAESVSTPLDTEDTNLLTSSEFKEENQENDFKDI